MISENDFLWFLQRRRSSTIDVRLISKYASAYILVSPIEIICILNIFAVKYIFSDKRMKNIIPGQHQEFFIYFKSTDQSFKNFLNIFGRLLLGLTIIRGICRTLSNIYNEAICKNNWGLEAVYYFLKDIPSEMSSWVLNTAVILKLLREKLGRNLLHIKMNC